MADDLPDPARFGAAFVSFMRAMEASAARGENELARRMREHLGREPKELPITGAEFATTDHPNLQLALDAVLPDAEVIGFALPVHGFVDMGLGMLLSAGAFGEAVEPGAVQFVDVEVGDGRVVSCIATGAYLASYDGAPVVLMLSRAQTHFGHSILRLDGIALRDGLISALLEQLRTVMRERNVYRGHVISLQGGEDRTEPTSGDAVTALDELLAERSTLTRRLLGQGAGEGDAEPQGPSPFPAMLHAFGAAGIALPEAYDE